MDDSKDDANFIFKHVIKRDGQLEIYDRTKIYDAIAKAAKEVDKFDVGIVEAHLSYGEKT